MNILPRLFTATIALSALLAFSSPASSKTKAAKPETSGHDWPQFGGNNCRNMVSDEKDLPDSFDPGDGERPTKNIRWIVQFRDNYVGANTPAIANGKVYIGLQYQPVVKGKGYYMPFSCLDEATGKPIWQLRTSGTNRTSTIGNTTAPTVDGNRVYCYRRNLIVSLTADGFTGKNQGPFTDEFKEYGLESNAALTKEDADIAWVFDLYEQLNVKITHCVVYAPLVYGNYVYASSGNSKTGADDGRAKLNTLDAPCFIVLDKRTGKLVAREKEGISVRNLRGQWGTASVGMINGKAQILFGGGDGVVYAFEPVTDKAVKSSNGVMNLKKIWSFDVNAHWKYRNLRTTVAPPPVNAYQIHVAKKSGEPNQREILLGAPVCHNNRVYIALSADWGAGPDMVPFWKSGRAVCIDATKEGDLTETGLVWENTDIGLSESTFSIADGLIYLTDIYGKVHCLDESTGKSCWEFDGKKPFYSSTLVADGKVYCGNCKGGFFIFKAGKELNLLFQTDLKGAMSGPLAVANRTLYVVAGERLYAIQKGCPSLPVSIKTTPGKGLGTNSNGAPFGPEGAPKPAPGSSSGTNAIATSGSATSDSASTDWPGFRGPGGNGISSSLNPPTSWDTAKQINIRWKSEVALPGNSSPVVSGTCILLTGAEKGNNKVFCYDLESGHLLWSQKASTVEREMQDIAPDTGYAPNTMAVDKTRAFAVFPSGDLNCFDLNGKELWHKDLGVPVNNYGFATSLLVDDKFLYLQFDDGANARMVAYDKLTGEIAWSKPRASTGSWASPTLTVNGKDKILITCAPTVMAYEALTGRELWQNACLDGDVAPSPAVDNGMAYVVTGNSKLSALDLKDGNSVWSSDDPEMITGIASPLAYKGLLYIGTEAGDVVCLNGKDGTVVWKKKLDAGFNASPLAAAGMIYFLDTNGLMTVLKAGTTYTEVAKNPLGEECHATPAFAGKRIIIRGGSHLFCIGADAGKKD